MNVHVSYLEMIQAKVASRDFKRPNTTDGGRKYDPKMHKEIHKLRYCKNHTFDLCVVYLA